jgi:quercetin dioxygenase-like cupin family protein
MSANDLQNSNRRKFLINAPAAAAAGLAFTDAAMFSAPAFAQAEMGLSKVPFTLVKSDELDADIKAEGKNANKILYTDANFEIALTTETATHGAEHEWHEYKDHIIHILDGTTMIEVGGTPKGAHKLSTGEWRAAECEGFSPVTLTKGDTLILPRGTPHRRITTGTVTLTLTSPKSPIPAA